MGRHRSGRQREAMLHADAARLLAEADYPPSVKQTILLALRGGRPGKQTCLACSIGVNRETFCVFQADRPAHLEQAGEEQHYPSHWKKLLLAGRPRPFKKSAKPLRTCSTVRAQPC